VPAGNRITGNPHTLVIQTHGVIIGSEMWWRAGWRRVVVIVLLNSWQVLSGYAHARPWSSSLGNNIVVRDPEPNPTTGTVTVSAEGDPDRLLDFAFRAILVIENAIGWLNAIST
jgi:hypothetical protein